MSKPKPKHRPIVVAVLIVVFIWYVLEAGGIVSAKQLYNLFGLNEFCDSADTCPVSVHFIDVGSGDSILICCEGHYALIDSGEYSISSKTASYLKKCGITDLDLVVATHPDSDHMGDMISVIANFSISVFWLGYAIDPDLEPYASVCAGLLDTDACVYTPSCGETFTLGSMTLEVLSPNQTYDDDNNNSIVIRAVYEDVSFLFMGDAESEAEEAILESYGSDKLQTTVLKLGHHGSKTSTTQEFFDAVDPEYTVISAGETNRYLPAREVVERVSATELFRTDFDGTVIIATDGTDIFTFKENE